MCRYCYCDPTPAIVGTCVLAGLALFAISKDPKSAEGFLKSLSHATGKTEATGKADQRDNDLLHHVVVDRRDDSASKSADDDATGKVHDTAMHHVRGLYRCLVRSLRFTRSGSCAK